ncbi:MAG TPA: hypothetical protein VL997_15560, partial [Dyella sp.]|nr:hypothetical protein [Dyella sp.]
ESIGVRNELLAVGVGYGNHETIDIGHGYLLGGRWTGMATLFLTTSERTLDRHGAALVGWW